MITLQEAELGSDTFQLKAPLARIPAGEATALVGRNGSGKTSLIEALLGLRPLRAGRALLADEPAAAWMARLPNRRRLGVQLQTMAYPTKTRVHELVQMHTLLYACTPDPQVARLFDVAALSDRHYEQLSRGEKQRVDLYLALAHGPELLLLDEPCTGLDARFHEHSLQWLAVLCQRRDKTVFFATHDARELQLAHHLLRIESGLLHQGTVAAGLAALGQYCGELALPAHPGRSADVLDQARHLPALTTAKPVGAVRVLAFGNGTAFKSAFEGLAARLGLPHTLRLVNHEDLLQATAHDER